MFEKTYTAKDEHIDFQGIMDGLHYPFYLEDCRHAYVEDILKFDMKKAATHGINVVLSQYLLKFRRSLSKGDTFTVSCTGHPDKSGKPQFHLKQAIHRDGKLITEALFTATCIKASGGRSFLPDDIVQMVSKNEPIDCPS